MIEENPTPVEEAPEPVLSPKLQNKILAATVVLLLMGASFVAGRYSVQTKPENPNPFAQLPTPMPVIPSAPVPESALTMINFKGVSESKKAQVLSEFNTTLCACNCKMSVAACIIRDPNCPFWKDHVTKLQKALGNGVKPDFSKMPKRAVLMPSMSIPPGSPNGLSYPQGIGK